MSLSEERMQVLKMVEEGKISAAEAAKLLAALEESAQKERQESSQSSTGGSKKRRVRICVTDSVTGRQKKVNVNLPFGVVNVARKIGTKLPADIGGVNVEELLDSIGEEAEGKVFDVQEAGGKRVEVFVE